MNLWNSKNVKKIFEIFMVPWYCMHNWRTSAYFAKKKVRSYDICLCAMKLGSNYFTLKRGNMVFVLARIFFFRAKREQFFLYFDAINLILFFFFLKLTPTVIGEIWIKNIFFVTYSHFFPPSNWGSAYFFLGKKRKPLWIKFNCRSFTPNTKLYTHCI